MAKLNIVLFLFILFCFHKNFAQNIEKPNNDTLVLRIKEVTFDSLLLHYVTIFRSDSNWSSIATAEDYVSIIRLKNSIEYYEKEALSPYKELEDYFNHYLFHDATKKLNAFISTGLTHYSQTYNIFFNNIMGLHLNSLYFIDEWHLPKHPHLDSRENW